jgi:hypothetical protein
VHPEAALDQRAGDTTQPEIDGEPDADWAAANDDDLTACSQVSPERTRNVAEGPISRGSAAVSPDSYRVK